MYAITTKYPTMDGEPHLGYVYETEVFEDYKGEVKDLVIDLILSEGVDEVLVGSDIEIEVPNTCDDWGNDVVIYAGDWCDLSQLQELVDNYTEDQEADVPLDNYLTREILEALID